MGEVLILLCLFSFAQAQQGTLGAASQMEHNKEEIRKSREIMRQNELQIKQAQEAIKQTQTDTKRTLDGIKEQDRLQMQRVREFIRQAELEAMRSRVGMNAQKQFDILQFIDNNTVNIIVISIFILLICISYKIASRDRRILPSERTRIKDNILATVNNWVFSEDDFKNYLNIFNSIIDPKILNVNTRQFKRRFITDLFKTEMIYQIAIDNNLDRDSDFINSLDGYADFFSNLDINNADILNSLRNYNSSFPVGSPYVAYYQHFLVLLLIAGAKNRYLASELYSKFLLVKKLISDLERDISICEEDLKKYHEQSMGFRDKDFLEIKEQIRQVVKLDKLQENLNLLIKRFKQKI